MLELLQFRYSPYNEKVRWALDWKHIAHTRRSLLPGPHLPAIRRLTGHTSTPVLVRDGKARNGSAALVEWLEEAYPEPALLPPSGAAREAARRVVRRFDEDVAPRGRRAVLHALMQTPGYFSRVFGDGRSALVQALYAMTLPLARPLIRKGNGIAGPSSIEDGMAAFGEGLDLVAREAAASGYLVGGSFTVADLSAASVLAMCVDPPDSPMRRPQPMPGPMARLIAEFAGHPGADWVRGIYARHRRARLDFDGPSPY